MTYHDALEAFGWLFLLNVAIVVYFVASTLWINKEPHND